MEGKLKYPFFVLVLSIASIAAQVNYIAKPGIVVQQIDKACKYLGLSAESTGIALIPETEWEGANQCSYESIACANCGAGSSSFLVVGFSQGDDADKIVLQVKQFPGLYAASDEIMVTYTHEDFTTSSD